MDDHPTNHHRAEINKLRRELKFLRNESASDRLLCLLYIHHGKEHGGVEYRAVDLEPPPAPPPLDVSWSSGVDLPEPQEDHDEELDKPRPKVSLIIRATARCSGLSTEDLLSSRRTADVVQARQLAAFLAKKLTLQSLPEIGRRLGNRDHTTILHSVRKVEGLVAEGGEYAVRANAIKKEIDRLMASELNRMGATCNSAQTAAA